MRLVCVESRRGFLRGCVEAGKEFVDFFFGFGISLAVRGLNTILEKERLLRGFLCRQRAQEEYRHCSSAGIFGNTARLRLRLNYKKFLKIHSTCDATATRSEFCVPPVILCRASLSFFHAHTTSSFACIRTV